MARTQAHDYDKRRGAIMETAAKLYAERGFLGTSVAQIADACGASKSLLYHYYPSKEDILFDVMDSHVQGLVEVAQSVEARTESAEARITLLATELMDQYAGAQAHQKVLLNELTNLPPDRRAVIIEHQRLVLDVVDRLILEIRPDLSRRKAQRRSIGMLFFGMLNWTHTWFNPSGTVRPVQFAHMAAQTFLAGLKVEALA